jgi:hypothetical protein
VIAERGIDDEGVLDDDRLRVGRRTVATTGDRPMTKDTNATASHAGTTRGAQRQVRRLERRLAAIRELEAKRRRQAAKARDRVGARELQDKRLRQLEKARTRSAALEAELASLAPTPEEGSLVLAAEPETDDASAAAVEPEAVAAVPAGPSAYCLREKRTVAMVDPAPFMMRNGRTGTSGTCPSCGVRVTRPG